MCGDGARCVALFRVGFLGTLFWTRRRAKRVGVKRGTWRITQKEYMFARKQVFDLWCARGRWRLRRCEDEGVRAERRDDVKRGKFHDNLTAQRLRERLLERDRVPAFGVRRGIKLFEERNVRRRARVGVVLTVVCGCCC